MTNPGNSVGTNGAYGGRTSVKAFNDVLSAFSGRGILSGWNCVPGGDMTLKLGGSDLARDVAVAENDVSQHTTVNNIGGQPIDVFIEAAPSVGSRIDLVVAYVNNPPQASTTNPLPDNPSACGLIAVMGNVSNNPTIPDETMIREAITADGASGANAYYVVLAKVAVGAGVTTLTANDITQGEKTTLASGLLANGEIGAAQIANGAVTAEKIPNGAVISDKIVNGAITREKLHPNWMYSPIFAENFAVSNDTPQGWSDALGGKGHYWIYYYEANKFAGQPSQWGFLEVFSNGESEVTQVWHEQASGATYARAGNAAGFNNWRPGGLGDATVKSHNVDWANMRTLLYQNPTNATFNSSNRTINLNQSAKNFKYLEFIYSKNNGLYFATAKIATEILSLLSNNAKRCSLFTSEPNGGIYTLFGVTFTLAETELTWLNGSSIAFSSVGIAGMSTGGEITIYRIYGTNI